MIIIEGPAGKNWINYCKAVLEKGVEFHDEDEKIKELLDVFLVFTEVDSNDEIFEKFADQDLLELYRKKMVSTKIVPELNASYGKRLYNQMGVNQVQWLIDRLKRKPETKAATISLLLPDDPGPRIPCLSVIDAKIRDGKLNLACFYRSQNAARAYGNFIGVSDLHKKIAKEVGYPVGEMKFYVASAHIYEKDFEKVNDLVKRASLLF